MYPFGSSSGRGLVASVCVAVLFGSVLPPTMGPVSEKSCWHADRKLTSCRLFPNCTSRRTEIVRNMRKSALSSARRRTAQVGDEKLAFDFSGVSTPAPVPLAHVPRFQLGRLIVEPALRQVRSSFGRTQTLEPLVLQLMIALRASLGSTLSRDDLIAACWNGRIVSDDAVNRVVSKLRRVLIELGEGAVRLETVPKVGYRIVADPVDPPLVRAEMETPEPRAQSPRPRQRVLSALALVAAVSLGGGFWAYATQTRASESLTIGVEPVASTAGDREVQAFASALTGDLAQMAGAISRVSFVENVPSGRRAKEDLVVRIAIEREGGRLVARPRLVDGANGAVLWSDRFESDVRTPDRLRQQVAMATAGVMRCGLERSAKVLGDAASIRLFFSACNAVMQGDPARGASFAHEIVARRPDVAAGWACLALTTLYSNSAPGNSTEKSAATAEATRYALKALELDPKIGRAYQALAVAAAQGSVEQFSIIEKGIAVDPELPALHRVHSYALLDAGYVRASVVAAQRALALDPTSMAEFGNVELRLMAVGRLDEARAMQAKAERLWPSEPWVAGMRESLLVYDPDPRRALAEMETIEAKAHGKGLSPLLRREMRWRFDPASRNLASLEQEAESAFAADPTNAWENAATFAHLGLLDAAFAWMARARRSERDYQWSLLFRPESAALRRDPRFFAAMARIGLADVWRARGQWPDFCSEPGLRYDCRTETARISGVKA
ncbi:winged helix-turn-helix domain-containing protein [Novosphingobium sp. Gsoil 351]|uniref:winged helix-turn-helix domain-containing protein n=1 Tax=Novosphingobium sp. Gsoil 351 TaxID=2675225 RepID=UPI0012B4C3A2|nr:winged helix-turn-helix domain-containing protein [Novosphingobium sp. Gsoil 351]QGN54141.1 hypothetical protein GKE62_05870 [Novosphingobium sp. Gsoil 351]